MKKKVLCLLMAGMVLSLCASVLKKRPSMKAVRWTKAHFLCRMIRTMDWAGIWTRTR